MEIGFQISTEFVIWQDFGEILQGDLEGICA
jgi:hypothetical protein